MNDEANRKTLLYQVVSLNKSTPVHCIHEVWVVVRHSIVSGLRGVRMWCSFDKVKQELSMSVVTIFHDTL